MYARTDTVRGPRGVATSAPVSRSCSSDAPYSPQVVKTVNVQRPLSNPLTPDAASIRSFEQKRYNFAHLIDDEAEADNSVVH
jgi:hypothetical protein